jgi:hypothetical protein
MKLTWLWMAFLMMCAGTARPDLTCWYNASGGYTGADDAVASAPLWQVTKQTGGGDYAYGFTVHGMPATDCPKQLPATFYADGPARVLQGTLTSVQNRSDHSTVYMIHDRLSDSDYGLSKCGASGADPGGLGKWVGKNVVVTASEQKGGMCLTGYLPGS